MSTSFQPPDPPATEAEFRDRLIGLIRTAYANDIDVEGAWADRNRSPDTPDWGIEIYEVTKPEPDGD